MDFRVFSISMRACTGCMRPLRSTKHCAGWRKLRFGAPTLGPKNDENPMLWLFAHALAFRTLLGRVPASSRWLAETPRTRPEALLEPLGAAQAVPRALLVPPGRVPDRSWAPPSVCRATPNASERSTAKLSCFFVVSVPIFLDSDELFGRLFGGLGILDTTLDSLSILSLDVPRCM